MTNNLLDQLRQLKPLPKPHHALTGIGEEAGEQARILGMVGSRWDTPPAAVMKMADHLDTSISLFGDFMPDNYGSPLRYEHLGALQEVLRQWENVKFISIDFEQHWPDDADELRTTLDEYHLMIRSLFPDATISWYGRGSIEAAGGNGWTKTPWWTGDEIPSPLSCDLYCLPELYYMRETIKQTIQYRSRVHLVRSDIIPRIALGAGYQRTLDGKKFAKQWNYNRWYSWQFGAEINIPWYSEREERYAPWYNVPDVVIYPPPTTNEITMKHFISYVLGATGEKRLEVSDET